jgi:DNA-binding NarL/FixJ family response regulator
MEKIKVFIADDHEIFCESLALLISIKGEAEMIGVATSAEEAIEKVEYLKPDIVLMDVEMKGLDGIDATRIIKERFPDTEVIILTMHANEEYILEAIKAGAKGYVLKDYSSSHILEAIKSVNNGGVFFDPKSSHSILKNLQSQFKSTKESKGDKNLLGEREIEVLKLVAEGFTNKEIGKKLFISTHTVRNHMANIFLKINCKTRTKAVKEAQKRRFF